MKIQKTTFLFCQLLLLATLFQNVWAAEGKSNDDDDDKGTNDLDYEIWDLMDSAVELFGPGLTWYELFDSDEGASAADIQKKYRKFSLQFHPDKNPSKLAAKKFQTLAAMAKILKDQELRARYDFWLENGVPYWRGKAYYFRKSENLSILQTALIVLLGAACMQYVTKIVRYMQIKNGLQLWAKRRTQLAAFRSGSPSLSKKLKQDAKKRRFSEERLSDQALGVFDDANMKQALDWLVLEHDIAPEVVVDLREWDAMISEDYGGEDSFLQIKFPSPLSTFMFTIPAAMVRKIFGSKSAEKVDSKDE